jgi:PAS domain S-box-containing protein
MVLAEFFIPHGHCYLWKPGLVGLHVVSDALTALAYYSIPVTLTYFVSKRRDVPFNWIFLLFSAFIISCGTTHILEIWTLWHPNYWLSGSIKAFTAVVSLYTASELVSLLPQALTIPSTAQLEKEIKERQKAEAALLKEKTHLAQAQKVAHVGSWEFDLATEEIAWSDETFRIYGLTLGQATPTITEHRQKIHPDDRTIWDRAVNQLAGGKPCQLEFRIVRPDGSIRHLLGQGEPILNADAQVCKLFGTVRDITERVAAQARERLFGAIALKIHQSLELDEILNTTVTQVRQLLQTDRVLIYRFNRDCSGQIVVESVGAGFPAVLDTTIHDPCFGSYYAQLYLQGRVTAIANIHTAGLQPCYLELLAPFQVTANLIVPILAGGTIWGLLIVHHCRGERHWQSYEIELLQQLATQVAIALQQSELYSRVQAELIERQRIEQELRVSEERYRSVVTVMSEGIVLQQADGEITACNASAERILGLTAQQMQGLTSVDPHWQAIREDGSPLPGELHPAMVTLRTGKPQSNVIMGIHKPDESLTWISINSQPLIHPGETQAYAVVTSFSDITERREAEEKLRKSEANLAAAQRVAHVGNWEFDVLTQEIIWSEELFRIFGVDPTEPEPTFDEHLQQIHPDDRALWQEVVGQALASGNSYKFDFRIVRPNDQVRYLEARGEAVFNEQGQVVKLFGTSLDITDRKRIEEALRTSEQRLRYLVSSSPSVIFSAKPDGDYGTNYISENVVNLLGYEAREFLEDSNFWAEHVHPDDVERIFTGLTKVFERDFYSHEYRFRRADGTYCWLLAQLRLMRDDTGRPSEMLGYLLDISDRKRTEATLQEAERRWRSLLENVQLLVVALDSRGNVEYINPFFLSLTGYTQVEVLGKNWFENFLPSSHQQQVNTVFNEVLQDNFHPHYTNPILTKSGEERFIAWNNTLLRDTDGNIIGTTSIGEDITQRQTIERIKNEFISIVSHELRTPLTAIRGSLGLLATGIYDNKPEKAKRMVEIALTDSDRLVRLVNDILDLERLDSGKVTLVKEVCEAADLMQQAVDGVRALADSAGITLCVSPVSAQVWVAPDTIIQTLTNLLSNAIKFSPSNTTITLTAQPQSDHVLFQVKDQGRGIPADKLEAIFGRFQQVDVSDSRQKGGTGLGLAICQSIVQQHGGHIWAESTLGEGSAFSFTLPVPIEQ